MKNIFSAFLSAVLFMSFSSAVYAGDIYCKSIEPLLPLQYYMHTKTNVDDDNVLTVKETPVNSLLPIGSYIGSYESKEALPMQFFIGSSYLVLKTDYPNVGAPFNTYVLIEKLDAAKNVVKTEKIAVACVPAY